MPSKEFVQKLGFFPKNNANGVFIKKFPIFDYAIEVDFELKKFNFGSKIKSDSGTTQNFSQEENWVVLECVNRLLEKGYKPEDIILEKTFKVGHGASGGRLDIFVKKDYKAFLMIECKTFGKEFEKELKNIHKDGGQLFTYFQNDTSTQYLMLYTSQFENSKIEFKNEIVKIEDHYRNAGNVVDFYSRWNKLTSQNGIFDDWVAAYHFENKLLTKKELKPLEDSDSGFIFNEFLSILRKHSVSDKPNAFNRIFNLFLAKIYDEQKRDSDELDFQWKEKSDNAVDFQIRLINLHKEGMLAFLRKETEGISDRDFNYKTSEELQEKKKKWLKFNKVFDIKDVIDDESFDDNQRVLKEVVQLLQRYQIRYPRRQQHLSDFFERLLTTGLKQESGQFFTPPPITKFIIKSLPLKQFIENELNQPVSKLPAIIDHAAGSGHFITEVMEQYQDVINNLNTSKYFPEAVEFVKLSKIKPYDWAAKYVYGVEKDYRLVKVAKVGCYFYGDGLAQIIHGDGLDNFKSSKSYVGLLKDNIDDPQKAKFSFVVSNPPYSVSAFKGDIKNDNVAEDFSLYKNLTDNSSEIECLFIERAKQLLKVGGVAALVLPSSILSNTGLYTKTREIILENFDIISIVELGSNTFMATGTNTVTLFLRRINNQNNINFKTAISAFFINLKDLTINNIEAPVAKYVKHVWGGLSLNDYLTLAQKAPNKVVLEHEIFIEYKKKIKAKNEEEFWGIALEKEKEKLYYFILAYSQKVVLIKSGAKDAEKRFLGYEFSNRRGSEGIHPIQRGKSIEECTQLFDAETYDNPEKASTYIYKAFQGDFVFSIIENLQKNISRHDLVDMLTFDRVDFEKNISLSLKKKIKIESKWELVSLGDISDLYQPKTITSQEIKQQGKYRVYGANGVIGFYDKYNHEDSEVAITCRGATCGTVNFTEPKSWVTGNAMIVHPKKNVLKKYLLNILKNSDLSSTITGTAQPQITRTSLSPFKIPLPSKDVQEKIVNEIEKLEVKEGKNRAEVEKLNNKIKNCFGISSKSKNTKIGDILILEYGSPLTEQDRISGEYPVMGSNGVVGYHNEFAVKGPTIIVGRKGSAGKITWIEKDNYPIDTTFYVKRIDKNVDYKFLYYMLRDIDLEKLVLGVGVPGLNRNDVYNQTYKLPSLQEQKKIVAEIENIEKQINILESDLQEFSKQKKEVLRKYL